MDANSSNLRQKISDLHRNSGIKAKIKSAVYRKIYKKIDLLSTETKETFSMLQNDSFFSKLNIHKIPNGVEDLPNVTNIKKENIMISVARFGSFQKNTELLLEALAEVDFKDWKVYCIGSIEKSEQDFEQKIHGFFEKHPNLKEKIIFTGNIEDKEKLASYYERAKVFILPSRYESFGIASLEATVYQDYIILTDVGAARDLVSDESFGYILPESGQDAQNETFIKEKLVEKLTAIISGKYKTGSNLNERIIFVKQFLMENIVKHECFKNWIF